MAMLARGDRLAGRGMKLLGFPHLCADVPGEFDVTRDGLDRILHVPYPARPGVVRALGGLQEALPCRTEPAPVQEVGPALHASSARAIDAPRFAASRIASLVRARWSRIRSASREWAPSDARTRSRSTVSSIDEPWNNASRARSRRERAVAASGSAGSHGSRRP